MYLHFTESSIFVRLRLQFSLYRCYLKLILLRCCEKKDVWKKKVGKNRAKELWLTGQYLWEDHDTGKFTKDNESKKVPQNTQQSADIVSSEPQEVCVEPVYVKMSI